MVLPQDIHEQIFSITTEEAFGNCALTLFRYQVTYNPVYAKWIKLAGYQPGLVNHWQEIPCLPIQFFKTDAVHVHPMPEPEAVFTSSATTGQTVSKHYVKHLALYERSFLETFRLFYGAPSAYCILALLPSYLERTGSSLVYMANTLIQASGHPMSNFFLHNLEELKEVIEVLKTQKQKVLLLGVSYALLDLAELGVSLNEQFTVMETGGMKGRRGEWLKEVLHQHLREKFKVNQIHSEYGMTELLSQAYLRDGFQFDAPPWLRFTVREVNDPKTLRTDHKTGGINVYDLANVYSCPFIATQDLGLLNANNQLQLMGRFDNSDVRGCNLMVD